MIRLSLNERAHRKWKTESFILHIRYFHSDITQIVRTLKLENSNLDKSNDSESENQDQFASI